jgi:ATP-dependent Zn protease
MGLSPDGRKTTLMATRVEFLLSEMDGFDSSVGLIILSATNRPAKAASTSSRSS